MHSWGIQDFIERHKRCNKLKREEVILQMFLFCKCFYSFFLCQIFLHPSQLFNILQLSLFLEKNLFPSSVVSTARCSWRTVPEYLSITWNRIRSLRPPTYIFWVRCDYTSICDGVFPCYIPSCVIPVKGLMLILAAFPPHHGFSFSPTSTTVQKLWVWHNQIWGTVVNSNM